MSKSPWGKVGNWAAETERAEAEEREAAEKAAEVQPPASFPTPKEAVSTAKQKKKTKMSLQEFYMQQPSTYSASRGLTLEEMARLPTGPKERSADETQQGRLGGGFSNYGTRTGSGGFNSGLPRDNEGRRSYGLDDDNRRGTTTPPESRVSDFNQPSRADEVDNWASMRRQTLPDYNTPQDRPGGGKYSSLGSGGGGPGVASRADEVDNWGSVKKNLPQTRSSSFGSGFSSRPEPSRWGRNEQSFGSGFSRPEPDRWNRNENENRLVIDSPKDDVDMAPRVNRPSPFGAARPREEVLAKKGLDWKKLDSEIEVKKLGCRPTSSQSSRPGSQESSRSDAPVALGGEGVVREKPKVNPFGSAKPREVLLEEKGLDWKKMDLELEHRRIERPETEEEKNLKEEIEHLKRELLEKPIMDQTSKNDLIRQKEQDLDLLVRQLDDNVRYSQKIFERKNSTVSEHRAPPQPGSHDKQPSMHGLYDEHRPPSRPGSFDHSRAGFNERPRSRHGGYEDPRSGRPRSGHGVFEESRGVDYNERPRSRHGGYEDPRSGRPRSGHGVFEENRGVDYNERPRSRGSVNSWSRPSDDGRFYQGGGGGRGFSGGREMDRSASRW